MQEIGTVISSPEGPSSDEFWFVIKENKGIPVRKGEFVQLQAKDGLLVARVDQVIKTNRYFLYPESVSEYEREGRKMFEQFPVERWEYLIAHAFSLGVYVNGTQQRVSFPVSPGDKVYKIDEKILSEFFGFDENGINIGNVEFYNVSAKLNITKLLQKHLAILAMSGAGKSYLTSVIIEELLDRPEELGRPAIIVVDPHGEYIGFAEDPNYISRTKVYNKSNISIATHHLSPANIAELLPQISPVQKRELTPIIEGLQERKRTYNMNELIKEVENSNINQKTKAALVAWLSELNSTRLFSNKDSPSIEELARAGQLSVLDLSDFVHLKERQIVLTYFARKLFDARRKEKIPPFVLFVEEAHQFAPGGEEEELAISRGVIEQIAREGRKFNACLVLISQRPKRLSTTALSQANTNIILRITNPVDLQHIAESTEGITKDVLEMIPGLKVGEALVVGEAVNYPVLVKVRERRSKKTEKGMKLEEALIKYNIQKGLDSKDLEAFM
jgi:DNA helicase HerA-like ATPase